MKQVTIPSHTLEEVGLEYRRGRGNEAAKWKAGEGKGKAALQANGGEAATPPAGGGLGKEERKAQ